LTNPAGVSDLPIRNGHGRDVIWTWGLMTHSLQLTNMEGRNEKTAVLASGRFFTAPAFPMAGFAFSIAFGAFLRADGTSFLGS